MNRDEQAMYAAFASQFALEGVENRAIRDAIIKIMTGRHFEDLAPSYQDTVKVLIAAIQSTLGIGKDDASAFSQLNQALLSGGYGRALAYQSGGLISSQMGASVAASHLASRMTEGGLGKALEQTGMSRMLVTTMLASLLNRESVSKELITQIQIKDLEDLRTQIDHDAEARDDEFTFSIAQRKHYRRLLRIADAQKEYSAAQTEYQNGRMSEGDYLAAKKKYDKFAAQEDVTEDDTQEIQAIAHGTLSVAKSRRSIADLIKTQMHYAAGTLRELADAFGTEDFSTLQAYAKRLGVNALETEKGIREMRHILNQASADAEMYGMSKEQAIKNRFALSQGLEKLYGGEQYVPVEAANRLHAAIIEAKNSEDRGYGGPSAALVTSREQASQLNTLKHFGAAAVAEEYVATHDNEQAKQLSGLLAMQKAALDKGDIRAALSITPMIKQAMYNSGIGFSRVDQARAVREGYLDEYYDKSRRGGIRTHIAADMKRLAEGEAFDTIAGELNMSKDAVRDQFSTMIVGVTSSLGTSGESIAKFIDAAKTSGSKEEFKARLAKLGVTEEEMPAIMPAFDFLRGNNTYTEDFLKLIAGDKRYMGVVGDASKRLAGKAFMDKLTSDTNSSAGTFGYASGSDFISDIIRGLVGGKQLSDANYLQLAQSALFDTKEATILQADANGNLVNQEDALRNLYNTNKAYFQERGVSSMEEFVRTWINQPLHKLQAKYGLLGKAYTNEYGTYTAKVVTEDQTTQFADDTAITFQPGTLAGQEESLRNLYNANKTYFQERGVNNVDTFVRDWAAKSTHELQAAYGLVGKVVSGGAGDSVLLTTEERSPFLVDNKTVTLQTDEYGRLINQEKALTKLYETNKEYFQKKGIVDAKQFVQQWNGKSLRTMQEAFGLAGKVQRNENGTYMAQVITEDTKVVIDKALDKRIKDTVGLSREEVDRLNAEEEFGTMDGEGYFSDAVGHRLGDRISWYDPVEGQTLEQRLQQGRADQTTRVLSTWKEFTKDKRGEVFEDKAIDMIARLYDAGDYDRAEELISLLVKTEHWGKNSVEMGEKLKATGRAGLSGSVFEAINSTDVNGNKVDPQSVGEDQLRLSKSVIDAALGSGGFTTSTQVMAVAKGMFGFGMKLDDASGKVKGGHIGLLGKLLKNDDKAQEISAKFMRGSMLSEEELAEVTNAINSYDTSKLSLAEQKEHRDMKAFAALIQSASETTNWHSLGFGRDGSGRAGFGEQQSLLEKLSALITTINSLINTLTKNGLSSNSN